jgi:hypothetical protein
MTPTTKRPGYHTVRSTFPSQLFSCSVESLSSAVSASDQTTATAEKEISKLQSKLIKNMRLACQDYQMLEGGRSYDGVRQII